MACCKAVATPKRWADQVDIQREIATAWITLAAGKREEALQTLERGYQMHDLSLMLWLPAYEEFDPLRSDPRFQKILHGMGIS